LRERRKLLMEAKMKKLVGLVMMLLVCSANATTFDLLAHWDFEGAAGTTTVYDSVSNRAASIIGTSLNGAGGVTLAGGTNAQYVDLGSSLGSLIGSISSYRIEMTFVWDGGNAGGGTAQKWWTFSQEGTTTFAMLTAVTNNDGYTRYQYRRDGSDTQANRSYGYNIIGTEMTIGIEYDTALGTSGFGVIRTLKNGVQEAYATQSRDCSLSLLGNTTRNYLGKSPYDAGNYFDGTIKDFKIYGVVPEPTTMVLLSVGALTLFRKRK
jgi:hypothetical protein